MASDLGTTLLTFSGPITALIWGAVNLFVRDKAREEIKLAVTEKLRAELAVFKNDLTVALNGTYVRSAGSVASGSEIVDRLDTLDLEMNRIRDWQRTFGQKEMVYDNAVAEIRHLRLRGEQCD